MIVFVVLLSLWFRNEVVAEEYLQLRPELYFGVRERQEKSLSFGLAWSTSADDFSKLHLDCREPNKFTRWGFEKADESFGKQSFHENTGFTLTTEHIFSPNTRGMQLRINGTSKDPSLLATVLLLLESPTSTLSISDVEENVKDGIRGDTVQIEGNQEFLRVYWGSEDANGVEHNTCTEQTVRIRNGKASPEILRTHFTYVDPALTLSSTAQFLETQLAQSKRRAMSRAGDLLGISSAPLLQRVTVPLLNNKVAKGDGRKIVVQRILRTPFSISVFLNEKTTVELDGEDFQAREDEFDRKFAHAFPRLVKSFPEQEKVFVAKCALANAIGSIGYFYGSNLLVGGAHTANGGLLSGVPSRSFFPRGFFWDEGFHQTLVSSFLPHLSKQVITSWLNRFEANGWVAREQILGKDAMEKVPPEFAAQDRSFANPPTLLLAVHKLLQSNPQNGDDASFFLRVFHQFSKHAEWLMQSQQSPLGIKGLLAWRGRSSDGKHTLPSGIDDYPRGRNAEAHVDLLSWSCWEDKQLAQLAASLGLERERIQFETRAQHKVDLLFTHHWNPRTLFFNDLDQAGFVSHIGYVGLMPFLLQLVPASDTVTLQHLLDHIDKNLRAPGIGLRSLAKSDVFFGQGENYWRGSVWINLHYLCVEALKAYSQSVLLVDPVLSERMQTMAKLLIQDAVGNIIKRYYEDGFLFENYDSLSGKGRGTRPFTGWTALLVLLMDATE